jgi:hypothetical protein
MATTGTLPPVISETLATAIGKGHREDAVLAGTGGPAGNARLTAWLGLVLLALFLAECATLISLSSLLVVHIFLGTFLVPRSCCSRPRRRGGGWFATTCGRPTTSRAARHRCSFDCWARSSYWVR